MYRQFGKRVFDLALSIVLLIIFLPVFLIVAILVKIDSAGPVFYAQKRVKKGNKDFYIFKFRTMRVNADKQGLLTTSNRDPRITRLGYYLRKYKIDELPQLFNILLGDMSFVGPRAEVRKYVDLYTEEQKQVLNVRPGLTDYAVLEFYHKEEEILSKNPGNFEEVYINYVMVEKNKLNLRYIQDISPGVDLKIILATGLKILKR
jgi:lipopolysaccharide/colanic/teichoic acid biosynthesis glycosyltransferase